MLGLTSHSGVKPSSKKNMREREKSANTNTTGTHTHNIPIEEVGRDTLDETVTRTEASVIVAPGKGIPCNDRIRVNEHKEENKGDQHRTIGHAQS